MSSFGEHLKRQRQMRGISLDEIMAITKISRRHLQALEDEQFELLPGGIFNRSYVRSYAKCVGIDEEEAVAEYLEAAREAPPDTRTIAQQHASLHSERLPERFSFPLVPVLILLVVAAGSVGGWRMYQERQRENAQRTGLAPSAEVHPPMPESSASASSQPQSSSPGTATENSPGNADAPVAATSSEVMAAAPPTPRATPVNNSDQSAAALPFVLVVRPHNRAWVSIKADGAYVVRGIIDASEPKTVRANTEIVFYAASAHSVDLSFNGNDVAAAEPASGPETLVFNAQGLLPKVPAQ